MPADPDGPWKQYRGDPAIRGGLFEQRRSHSVMDEHLGEVFAQVDKLIRHHGVFHASCISRAAAPRCGCMPIPAATGCRRWKNF